MVRRKNLGFLVCALVLVIASTTWAGIPDPTESYATNRNFPVECSILVVPDGSGTPINSCYWDPAVGPAGPHCDATIDLWVLDAFGDPIYLYPFSDMWLESDTHVWYNGDVTSMVHCVGGTVADQSTDLQGHTLFSGALFAGCCGEDIKVLVNGWVVQILPDKRVNSPDMSCDLVVNLTDVILFATSYYGVYEYCADFYWDLTLNLSDIVVMAQAQGAACP